jgi:hypothetical protein
MSADLLKAANTRAEYILKIISAAQIPKMGNEGYNDPDIALRDADDILSEINGFINRMHNYELLAIKYYTARKRAEISEKKLKGLNL